MSRIEKYTQSTLADSGDVGALGRSSLRSRGRRIVTSPCVTTIDLGESGAA